MIVLDAEVAQVLRRLVQQNLPLLRRAFELRDNATIYDALYIVLAEGSRAPLLTRDAALARVPGHGAIVEVIC